MKNTGKKILGLLLVIIILSTNMSFAFNQKQLDNEKKSNNQQIEETKKEKEKIHEIKDKTVKEVASLDKEIDSYQSEINNLDSKISNANSKIEETNAKINKAKENYEKQQQTLEERIVALYEAGETSYLDVLLSSDNIGDFISSYYIISEIAESDTELLNSIEKEKKEIERAKQELEESKKELTEVKQNKVDVSNKLEKSKSEKSKRVEELSEEEKNLQAKIDEMRQINIGIDAQILKYQQELERKRKEEEKKNQNNKNDKNDKNNNTTGTSKPSTNPSKSGFINPVPSAYAKVTTGWYYSSGRLHGAVDFGTSGINGQPIYAVADGYVVTTQALTTSYGNYILIAHDNGLYTLYAHGQLGSIAVSQGQRVKQGQQIMRVGSTGNSSGPHLHFEVRTSPGTYENRKNPINYLP